MTQEQAIEYAKKNAFLFRRPMAVGIMEMQVNNRVVNRIYEHCNAADAARYLDRVTHLIDEHGVVTEQ